MTLGPFCGILDAMRSLALGLTAVVLFVACAKSGPVGFQNVGGTPAGGGGSGGDGSGGAGGAGNHGNTGGAGNAGNTGGSGNTGNTGTGGSGNTGNAGTGGSGNAGNAGGSGGSPPPCVDTGPGEANETELSSHNLGSITDCDGDGDTLSGVITGPNDVDWYRYSATDSFGCVVDATRGFSASGSLRLCKFVECVSGGGVSFDCPGGTQAATSPGGRPGCCGTAGFDIAPDCAGVDDDTVVFIRVDDPQGLTCVDYTLSYHY